MSSRRDNPWSFSRSFSRFRPFSLDTVVVEGDSMVPTYQRGDWLLVRRFRSGRMARLRVGQVLLIERYEQPGVLFIKRLTGIRSDSPNRHYPSFWVEGDNASLSQDSRSWGALDGEEIVGKVLFRFKRNQRAN